MPESAQVSYKGLNWNIMQFSVPVCVAICHISNCSSNYAGRDIIGLAVIMAGTAMLLAFYSIMLWWRTQLQSSRSIAVLLLAVALLCAYELCAVYVTAGSIAPQRYSPSGFFFGVSAIALAINMLFICRMVSTGNGLDVDKYVRSAYKFAYSNFIEVGPIACLREPPDPIDLYPRQSRSFLFTLEAQRPS